MVIELLSITFFSGMMSIFVVLLLLIGALLLIGKNPFRAFSLTALVTSKPLATRLSPYGKTTGWKYGFLGKPTFGGAPIGKKGGETKLERVAKSGGLLGIMAKTVKAKKEGTLYFGPSLIARSLRSSQRQKNMQEAQKIANVINDVKTAYPQFKSINDEISFFSRRHNANVSQQEYLQFKEYKRLLGIKKPTQAEKQQLGNLRNSILPSLKNGAKSLGFQRGPSVGDLAIIVALDKQLAAEDELIKSHLEGVAAGELSRGKSEKEVKATINKLIREYNQQVVNMSVNIGNISYHVKKMSGEEIKFDLPTISISKVDPKEILDNAKNITPTQKAGLQNYYLKEFEDKAKLIGYIDLLQKKSTGKEGAYSAIRLVY